MKMVKNLNFNGDQRSESKFPLKFDKSNNSIT